LRRRLRRKLKRLLSARDETCTQDDCQGQVAFHGVST